MDKRLIETSTLDDFVTEVIVPSVPLPLEVLGAMQHQSAWADVQAKALRLIRTGKVTILYNSPTAIYGHVVGDHGVYNTGISRTDPNSSTIDQWHCECPWDQYAFGRTRRYKHLEGRCCSHVLATYFKGKSTPYDHETDEEPPQTPRGQRRKPHTEEEIEQRQKDIDEWKRTMKDMGRDPSDFDFAPAQLTEEDADAGINLENLPRSYSPEGEIVDLPTQRQLMNDRAYQHPAPQSPVIPGQPKNRVLPPHRYGPLRPQKDHMQLFDIIPPQPGAQDAQPQQPSRYDPKQIDPSNPMQSGPATLSHIPVISVNLADFHYAQQDDFGEYVQNALRSSQRVVVQLRQPVLLEQKGGKIPMPGAQPQSTNSEGISVYRTLDLGYDPTTGQRVRADGHIHGAPEQQDVFTEAPRGRRGEVTDIQPTLKWVYIQIPLNLSGPLHPHHLSGWVSYDDVMLVPDAKSPFWKGR